MEKEPSRYLTHPDRYTLYKFIEHNANMVRAGMKIKDFTDLCSEKVGRPVSSKLVGQICIAFNIFKHQSIQKPAQEVTVIQKIREWFTAGVV